MKPEHNEEYENFTQILGGNLKFIRLKNYKPQKSLAFALGVSHQNVQKYESGEIVPGAFRLKKIAEFEKKHPDQNKVPRPPHWSGWRILPKEIEFWLDGEGRIHERLNYVNNNGKWIKEILYP